MLLQAFDFLNLFQDQNCRVQGGGSDQWGNITAGIELIRRKATGQAFGITFPLLTTSSGEKFGKSAGNAIWLDPNRTSPYQFYQYWINTDDRDAERFLKLFTFLELEEITALCARSPEQRIPQKRLAAEVTRLVHGQEAVAQALKASEVLFGGDVTGLSDKDLAEIFSDVPSFSFNSGARITDAMVLSTAASSKSEAVRLLKNGGVYWNNQRVTDPQAELRREDLAPRNTGVLRVGKKSYYLGRVNI
jgi:tyrosyl-tRNA synthetase